MKHLILLGWLLGVMLACQAPSFRLEGCLNEGARSKMVHVYMPGSPADSLLTTLPLSAAGQFHLKLPANEQHVLEIKDDKNNLLLSVITENGKFEYRRTKEGSHLSAPPGSLQKSFNLYLQEALEREQAYNRLCSGYDTIGDMRKKAEQSILLSRQFQENEDFRLKHIRTFAGTEIAQYIIYRMLYYYESDYPAFTRALEALGDTVPDSRMKTAIFSSYATLKSEQLTGPAPAFTLSDPHGKSVSLSDFQGKYVLVDFWASWCAPCRAKNKELFKSYPLLHRAGVEIISISLDDRKDKWLEAIQADGVNWVQLSDLKGFRGSEVAKAYKIKQVPTVFLIGPAGEIIKTNPTHSEIKELIKPSR